MSTDTSLPPMRLLGPARVSRDPIAPHPGYRELLEAAPVTGVCPVQIGGFGLERIRPPDAADAALADARRRDPQQFLSEWWPGACQGLMAPFGNEFPGLVDAAPSEVDALDAAVDLAALSVNAHLALVPAHRPADVPVVLGWTGTCNYHDDLAGLGAVLRSWEDRFGALLVRLDMATMWLSVASPPTTEADCLGVAAEHFAFCLDVDTEDPRPLTVYASTLRRNRVWRFWWD